MIDHKYGVVLRPLSEVPAETLRDWRNEPEIYKWCRQYEPLEKWDHKRWVDSMQAGKPDVRMYSVWSAGSPLGVCGLTSIDWVNSRAEFSLYIIPEKQKNGFGRMALKTLCHHAFNALNLNSVWGESFFGNNAVNMFQSIGFKLDGARRAHYYRDGGWLDAYLFSLLKKEFENGCFDSDSTTNHSSVISDLTLHSAQTTGARRSELESTNPL